MGCDIHAYVEYDSFTSREGKPYWVNFTKNGGSRNYVMFGVLAGVRVEEAKLFDPKGMPDGELGYDTASDYWTAIAPEAHPEWADDEGFVSIERAQGWVDSGYAVGELDEKGRLRRVSDPDAHSNSWLTTDELAQAIDHYSKIVGNYWPGQTEIPAEWAATLAAMRSFEASGKQARLVFWFDN